MKIWSAFLLMGAIIALSAGNSASATLVVPAAPYHIYLTFDDGPLEGSEDINAVVAAEKIKVNIFVVGANVRSIPRMKNYFHLYETNAYIEIGNHSYSHAHNEYRLFYDSPEAVYSDFLKNESVLQLKLKQARLPGRNMWRLGPLVRNDVVSGATSADLLQRNGFSVFGWDIEWQHDPKSGAPIQTVDDIAHQIESLLKNHLSVTDNHIVILCHDEMFRKDWEKTELKQLIERLRATGQYEFNFLSEYPVKPAAQMTNKVVENTLN